MENTTQYSNIAASFIGCINKFEQAHHACRRKDNITGKKLKKSMHEIYFYRR